MSSADKAPRLRHGHLLLAQREPAVPALPQHHCSGRSAPSHKAALAFLGQMEGQCICRAGSRVAWALFSHWPKAPSTSSSARDQADGQPGCGKPAAAYPAMPPRTCSSVPPGRPPSPASPQVFAASASIKLRSPSGLPGGATAKHELGNHRKASAHLVGVQADTVNRSVHLENPLALEVTRPATEQRGSSVFKSVQSLSGALPEAGRGGHTAASAHLRSQILAMQSSPPVYIHRPSSWKPTEVMFLLTPS